MRPDGRCGVDVDGDRQVLGGIHDTGSGTLTIVFVLNG